MKKLNRSHLGALGFLLNGSLYLLVEFVAALGTGRSLSYIYGQQFISALGVYNGQAVDGVPENFSPLALVMNIGFILTALGFFISYTLLIYPKIKRRSSLLASALLVIPLVFCIGSVLVGLYQGGVPGQDGLHGLGARLSFLMGNATLLTTGIFLPDKNWSYRLTCLTLGITGFIAAGALQSAITANQTNVMAIYERLTVYPITAWQLMTGLTFIKTK